MMEDEASNNPAMTRPATHTFASPGEADLETGCSSSSTSHHPPSAPSPTTPSPPTQIYSKYDHGWRRIIRNFSPSWFTPTMGTGIVSVLLQTIPFATTSHWLPNLSLAFFALNALLFLAALSASLLRYTLYPEIWTVMLRDSTNSLFLATAPMGLATLLEMWTLVCVPAWGPWATSLAWAVWMLDAVLAVATTVFLCFLLISASHQTSLESVTALQLLPIAATVVAAGVGSEVAAVLPNDQHALATLLACYVMWGVGVPMALMVLVMYYQRLAVHKLPPREVIVSCFLPLGPLGFGGFTVMNLGKVCLGLLPRTGTLPLAGGGGHAAGVFFYLAGYLAALVMWGFGLIWLCFATAAIVKVTPRFSMGFWGFTFPLGVFASSTIQIGVETPSLFFRVLGTILAVAVVLLWLVCAIGTAKGAISGKLFHAPCLNNLKDKHLDKGRLRVMNVDAESGDEKAE